MKKETPCFSIIVFSVDFVLIKYSTKLSRLTHILCTFILECIANYKKGVNTRRHNYQQVKTGLNIFTGTHVMFTNVVVI